MSSDAGSASADAGISVPGLDLQIDPGAVDFGPVHAFTEATQVILLRNTGTSLIMLEGVSRGPRFDDGFTFDINRLSIPPSSVAQLSVRFAPEELGEKLATIVIRFGTAEVPDVEIGVRGEGVITELIVAPENVSFGSVVINTARRLPITVTNSSDVDGRIELIEGQNVKPCSAGGSDPAVFCVRLRDRNIDADGRFSLRAGESVMVEVEFVPIIARTRERGHFTLRACDHSACETQVRLDGVGIFSGFHCDPAELDFGRVGTGGCVTRTVGCENLTAAPITVVGWGPSPNPPTSSDFTVEASVVAVLAEGNSIDVEVTYCPSDAGTDEGELWIETDQPAPNRFVQVPLVGTSP